MPFLKFQTSSRVKKICRIIAFFVIVTALLSAFDGNFPGVLLALKAFLYRSFHISTDTMVYAKDEENVFLYSRFKLNYIISGDGFCSKFSPFVIIFVKTHPKNFEERNTIRRTWGNVTKWKNFGVKRTDAAVLFVLGLSKTHEKGLQSAIEQENEQFHDLVQENYVEDFHNLTLKLVSHLKWPIKFCPDSKYWMTTDDDVFIHIGNLVSHLKKAKTEGYYSGLVHYGSPRDINPKSKYFVSSNIYKGVYYPDYCPGAGYVLSLDVVKRLLKAVDHTPLVYIDDVYTGILAHFSGVWPVHYVMFLGEKKPSSDLCTLSKFITSHGHHLHEMYEFFDTIMSLSKLDPDYVCWNSLLSWVNSNDLVYF